jgi:hypothetical protein
MRRRHVVLSVGLILGFVALVLIGIVVLVKTEPDFYVQAEMEPSTERAALSQEAVSLYWRILPLLEEPGWKMSLSDRQINAFFQDDYYKVGGDDNLPDGIHAPRVKIEDDRLRLGARWGSGWFSTVLSLEIRAWKVADESNTLAMEIVSFRAGAMPLSTSTLLDNISSWARREHIDITWYRKEGHPVAIMRFQADLNRPTFQFDDVELKDGSMTVSGRSTDPFAPPAPRVVSKP